MTIGFVTIMTSPRKEQNIYKKLLELDEVVEAEGLLGEYDIIAKLDCNNFSDIGKTVIKIRTISGVEETNTMVVSESKEMPSYYRN